MGEFIIDPRVWILPPYVTCPACGAEEYGVLMITGSGYVRRCRNCMSDEQFPLPSITKKLLYVDTFAISNMMKALNPADRNGELDSFWKELFTRLDRLVKLQVLVCPASAVLEEETAVGRYPAELKRMYRSLGNGLVFDDDWWILAAQAVAVFKNWVAGVNDDDLDLDPDSVIHGGSLHDWSRHYGVSVGGLLGDDWPDQLRAMRDEGHQTLVALLERRQNETDRTFDDWYREQLVSWGRNLYEYGARSEAARLLQAFRNVLEDAGVDHGGVQAQLDAFLGNPENVERIPALRIQCLLFAAQAQSVANGRRRPPSRGTINDVRMIGGTLPYADAIFLDNEMAEYLRQGPVQGRLGINARVFSQNTRDELVAYLDEIRDGVTETHRAAVEEVYGPEWLQPYTGPYEVG